MTRNLETRVVGTGVTSSVNSMIAPSELTGDGDGEDAMMEKARGPDGARPSGLRVFNRDEP